MQFAEEREYGRKEKFGRDVTRDNQKSKMRAMNSLLRRGIYEEEDDDFDDYEEDDRR